MVCSRPLGSVSWTRSPTVSGPRRRAGPSGTSAGAASEEGGGVTVEESTKSSGERGAPGRTRSGGLLCEAPAAALAQRAEVAAHVTSEIGRATRRGRFVTGAGGGALNEREAQ